MLSSTSNIYRRSFRIFTHLFPILNIIRGLIILFEQQWKENFRLSTNWSNFSRIECESVCQNFDVDFWLEFCC